MPTDTALLDPADVKLDTVDSVVEAEVYEPEAEILPPIGLESHQVVTVRAAPNPFSVVTVERQYQPGLTLQEILEDIQPKPVLRQHAHIFIDDHFIPRQNWRCIRPKPGTRVSIRTVASGGGGGGGGKSPLRILLTIVIVIVAIVASVYLGPLIGGLLASQLGIGAATAAALGAAIASSVVLAVGTLIINAVAPPPKPTLGDLSLGGIDAARDSPTLFITGARNQFNPFGVIPRPLGKHRMVPPYGARPYTEIVGDDQYLRILVVWGYGPLTITDLRIGETAIENYEEVEVITRQGFPGEPFPELFSQDIFEEPLSILIDKVGGWRLRTSQQNANEIIVDLVFANGLVTITSNGAKTTRHVQFAVEYSVTGAAEWKGGGHNHLDRESPAMPAATLLNGSRYDMVVVDRFTGDLSVITGVEVVSPVTPSPPLVPETKVPIARVYRDSSATISSGNITDQRPAGYATNLFSDAASFAPSATSPVSNKIAVAAGGIRAVWVTVSAATTSAVRRSVRIATGGGQYDVRVSRITDDNVSLQTSDQFVWTAIRTVTHSLPILMDGLAMTAVRIKATDELNGVVDQLNGIVQSILLAWDDVEGDWILKPTSQPSACYREVCQGAANARPEPDASINLTNLEEWAEFCKDNSFEFNLVIDYATTVDQVLQLIAAVGRSARTRVDGKWGVVIDKPKGPGFDQYFTERNTWGYRGKKIFNEEIHGWRVRYVNRDSNWNQDERIVYADGYSEVNADKFAELQLIGITDPEHIWKDGRYHIGALTLRPESHEFNVDPEYLLCTQGSLVSFTHSVPLIGIGSGRIKQVVDDGDDITALILDEKIEVDISKLYSIRIRYKDGSQTVHNVTVTGDSFGLTNTFAIDTPIPLGAGNPEVGDIVGFGERGIESLSLLVKTINTLDDDNVTLICVDYAPDIYNIDSGTIPPYQSYINAPSGADYPAISFIRSDESVLLRMLDGSNQVRILIKFGFSLNRPQSTQAIEVRWRQTDSNSPYLYLQTGQLSSEISITEVEAGVMYDLQARYITTAGPKGWSPVVTHTVVGAGTPPPDIDAMYRQGNNIVWQYLNPPPDHKGFLARTVQGTVPDWINSSPLPSDGSVLTQTSLDVSLLPSGARVVMIRAIDAAGLLSVNYAYVVIDLGDPETANVVFTDDLAAGGFTGTKVNCTVDTGVLKADDTGDLYLPSPSALYLPIDGDLYLPVTYYAMSWNPTYTVSGTYLPCDIIINMTIQGRWTLKYRTDGGQPYVAWPGRITAESGVTYDFLLEIEGGDVRGEVSQFDIVLDVEDEEEILSNITIADTTGTRLPITKTFRAITNITMSLVFFSGTTAVFAEIQDYDEDLGPLIKCFNGDRSSVVEGKINAIIKGQKG